MSLQTDIIFFEALKGDTALMTAIGNRLYNTTIPVPDERLDSVPVPYIIVTFDGLNNTDTTKDDPYDGSTDNVQIGIEVAATNREELASLTKKIRRIIHEDFMFVRRYSELCDSGELHIEDCNSFQLMVMRDYDEIISEFPQDYTFSAEAVQCDFLKPCFWQILHLQCSIENSYDYEQD